MAAKVCKGHQRTKSSAFSVGVSVSKSIKATYTAGPYGILRDPTGLGHLEVSKIMTSCYAVVDGLIT